MGDEPVAWAWSVVERDGGAVLADPATGSARYYPPFVLEPTVFHIRASAADGSGRSDEAAVLVHPHGAFRQGPVSVIGEYAGRHWHLPRLEGFAGSRIFFPIRDGHGDEAVFYQITDILWVPRHPNPRLSGRWLIADKGAIAPFHPDTTADIGGMAVDGEGRLWVTFPNKGVVRTFSRDGSVRTLAGRKGQCRRVDGGREWGGSSNPEPSRWTPAPAAPWSWIGTSSAGSIRTVRCRP